MFAHLAATDPEAVAVTEEIAVLEADGVSVRAPLLEALKPEHYGTVTREVFGPLQVVIEWEDGQLPLVLQALERMEHLSADQILEMAGRLPLSLAALVQAAMAGEGAKMPPNRCQNGRGLGSTQASLDTNRRQDPSNRASNPPPTETQPTETQPTKNSAKNERPLRSSLRPRLFWPL
jgi:hypothetical protein